MTGEGPKSGEILKKVIADTVHYRATEEKGDRLWKSHLDEQKKNTEKSTKLELIDNSLLNNIWKGNLAPKMGEFCCWILVLH